MTPEQLRDYINSGRKQNAQIRENEKWRVRDDYASPPLEVRFGLAELAAALSQVKEHGDATFEHPSPGFASVVAGRMKDLLRRSGLIWFDKATRKWCAFK